MPGAAGPGAVIDGLCPRVALPAAAGEVDHGLAQPVVAAVPEHHLAGPARGPRGGRDAGSSGQCLVGREPSSGIADLGQQRGRPDRPGVRQAGEHRCIRVSRQGLRDVVLDRG